MHGVLPGLAVVRLPCHAVAPAGARVAAYAQLGVGRVTPAQQAELEAIAVQLDALALRATAARLRNLLSPPPDERPCAIQDETGQLRAIPWGLAEILYPAYGHSQELERLHERGGFSRIELGLLAVDQYGWSPGSSRVAKPRLPQMPLLQLYAMAMRGQQ